MQMKLQQANRARPRDPPDAVLLQQIQNRGNGKNLYRGPPSKDRIALAPESDNPENLVWETQLPGKR